MRKSCRPARWMTLGALLVLVGLTVGCSSSGKNGAAPAGKEPKKRISKKQPGSGCDNLVPIRSTKTPDGIAAENRWLREKYGEYRKKAQDLIFCDNGKMADRIEIELPDGRVVEVYFDISRFFGKF